MATYNGAAFLRPQLESLAQQMLKPCEIVINDDGSNDQTPEIVTEFIRSSGLNVRFERNAQRLGYADNFLTAASRATGDLIAFCDQDDVWHPEKLARVSAAFADPSIVLCAHRARLIDAEGEPIGVLRQGEDSDRLHPARTLSPFRVNFGFTITFRRQLLSVIPSAGRVVDYMSGAPRLSHDRWIGFLASHFGATFEMADYLVDYRQHGRNVFGAHHKPNLGTAEQQREARLRYCRAANEFLAQMDRVDRAAASAFPAFDRDQSRAFLARLAQKETQRGRVYEATNPVSAVGHVASNLFNATYAAPGAALPRPGPVARDLYFSLFKVRGLTPSPEPMHKAFDEGEA